MVKGSGVIGVIGVALLVTACTSSGQASDPASFPLTTTPPVTTATPITAAATTAAPTTTIPPLSITPTTLAPITLPPTVASSTPAVTTSTSTSAPPRAQCLNSPSPPTTAKNLQVANGDIDGDGAPDTVWIYDMPDGPHLQIHTSHGATASTPFGFGKSAAALGFTNVDYSPAAGTGKELEVLAAASEADGSRTVGVFYYVKATGCLDIFHFASGAPFQYRVSRSGDLSGLKCTTDAAGSHLESLTATPQAGKPNAYDARTIVFGLNKHSLVPVLSSNGTLTLPKDQAALAPYGNLTGCIMTRPLF
jgi:hypothetical protein